MAENVLMSDMSWTEVEQALKERPIALVAGGQHRSARPAPARDDRHGDRGRDGAPYRDQAEAARLTALIAPPITFSVSQLAADMPGTIGLPPETVVALLRDVSLALSKKFRAVAFVSVNQEAANLDVLKKAAEEAKKAGGGACLTEFAKKRWVDRLGKAFSAGDHAGSFETSLMMACARAQVREKERISLPPMDGLAAALKGGATSFAAAGGEDAYFGDPGAASAEDGEAYFETLADILTLSIMEYLGSKA